MANVLKKLSISYELAQQMVDAAVAKARELGVSENVAIIDDGGNLKAFGRMDGASILSTEIAQNKAYTALFGISTQDFFNFIQGDPSLLAGILTDGDLRRHMRVDLLQVPVDEVMTRSPKTVRPDQMASEALQILNSSKITALFVVEQGLPVGIVHFHDLLRAGVA